MSRAVEREVTIRMNVKKSTTTTYSGRGLKMGRGGREYGVSTSETLSDFVALSALPLLGSVFG